MATWSSFPRRARSVAPLLVLGLLGAAGSADADEFRVIPEGTVKQEFNDNIFFSTRNGRSSFISTLAAGVSILDRNERLNLKGDARVDGLLYSADDLNAVEQRYHLLAEYQLSPLLGVRGSAGFDRETRSDRLIETSGMVVLETANHQAYSLGGNLTLTDKLSGVTRYGYDAVDYDHGGAADVERHDVTVGAVYDLGRLLPLLKSQLSGEYSVLLYREATVENWSATVGMSYQFHELWSVQGDLGGRLTNADFSVVATDPSGGSAVFRQSNRTPGWVTHLSAFYKGETDTATFSVSRDVQMGAGTSGAVESTGITAFFTRELSAEMSAAVWAGIFFNTAEAGELAAQRIDQRSFSVNPTLRYQISRELTLDLSYAFALVQYRSGGTEAMQNRVFVSLTMQRPFFEHR